ncbi:outer membrane protein assembly factor BamB family protein [Spirosoma humi]
MFKHCLFSLLPILFASLLFVTCRRHRDPEPDKNSVVFIGAFDYKGGTLNALDAQTGEINWTFQTQSDILGSPTVAKGVVYIGSEKLYAIDISTGKQKWAYNTGDFVYSSPIVANGIVYVGCNNGYLFALDAATGQKKWDYKYPEQQGLSATLLSSPRISGSLVYINTLGGRVLALDTTSGKLKWEFLAEDHLKFNPILQDDTVYINCLHILYALDAGSGNLIWRQPINFDLNSNMAANKTTIFGNNISTALWAFDKRTGKPIWTVSNQDTFMIGTMSGPELDANYAYLSMGEGNLYAIDITQKKIKWRLPTGSPITASPTVANGILYIGNFRGQVYAVNASTGEVIWSKQLSQAIDVSSACVLTTFGNIYGSSTP